MTTFQYLVEAFIGTLASILPIPRSLVGDLYTRLLQWSESSPDLLMLVLSTVALYLLYFFRFDFLGLISAFLHSLVRPASLRSDRRSLDQHILLFFLIVLPFYFLGGLHLHGAGPIAELEWIRSPITHIVLYLLLAFGFHFSKNWNKRIKGLNHLKLIDALRIGALSILTWLDPIPWIAVLWIGFALTNYHFEAIFKYSYLLITFSLLFAIGSLWGPTNPLEALRNVGYLNSIAVIAISLTTVYMLIEHLERTLSEATYKNARNWCILCAIFYGVLLLI